MGAQLANRQPAREYLVVQPPDAEAESDPAAPAEGVAAAPEASRLGAHMATTMKPSDQEQG
ncbi:Uncharacterised protein [Mycobacteroides abscessus subsp. abscessus]|nr:Uncharacterised protein [Mycobacteroides abscessus subsp. abscessus]